ETLQNSLSRLAPIDLCGNHLRLNPAIWETIAATGPSFAIAGGGVNPPLQNTATGGYELPPVPRRRQLAGAGCSAGCTGAAGAAAAAGRRGRRAARASRFAWNFFWRFRSSSRRMVRYLMTTSC